jgi:hypothetical protein
VNLIKLRLRIAKLAQEHHKRDHDRIERARQARIRAQRERKKKK